MEDKFDCIIVGGGIAGLSAAMVLARADAKFLLIERGEFSGAKNVSGGVLWGTDLATLVPDYWKEDAGFERYINHRRLTFLDRESSFSIDFKSAHLDNPPYKGISVLRARFDNWLAEKVQEAIDASTCADESFLVTNILVDEVLKDNGKITGIRAGEENFLADSIILAEGVNNLLTRAIGLQDRYVPADHVAVGVKEIIRFDRKTLENRFQLDGLSGMSNEIVGFATEGVEGGGFIYTNRDTVSVGLVLGMKDLREKRKTPYDLLNTFKSHPAIEDILKDGEAIEYSAHVVSTGDMAQMPHEIFADGVLVAGEAAGLLLNAGRAIQGMDYAMRSGILAANTVLQAKDQKDFSVNVLKNYRHALEQSFVLKDLHGFQDAVRVLHSPQMFEMVPNLVCDFGRNYFTVDSQPTRKASRILLDSIKKHGSYWDLIKLGFRASRSL